jgi:hypothetical protein
LVDDFDFHDVVVFDSNALALIVTASFCAGVRRERYSEEQEIAANLIYGS